MTPLSEKMDSRPSLLLEHPTTLAIFHLPGPQFPHVQNETIRFSEC